MEYTIDQILEMKGSAFLTKDMRGTVLVYAPNHIKTLYRVKGIFGPHSEGIDISINDSLKNTDKQLKKPYNFAITNQMGYNEPKEILCIVYDDKMVKQGDAIIEMLYPIFNKFDTPLQHKKNRTPAPIFNNIKFSDEILGSLVEEYNAIKE
ncbi:hypothetical protein GQ473_00135 [archaeon]|nr:hypothetical protein [archaeon]